MCAPPELGCFGLALCVLLCVDIDLLTSSEGFIMGYAWKLVLKKPIQKKVVFWATEGRVSLMISAAWSLPCDIH
jgi:hypothetical protein